MKRWRVKFAEGGMVKSIDSNPSTYIDTPPHVYTYTAFVSAEDELGAFALATRLWEEKHKEQADEVP
jgi:hypothetical protein